MIGPCMCGDPYCASCGSPAAAELEAAEEAVVAAMQEAKLTADEHHIFLDAGLAAVKIAREAVANYLEVRAEWQSGEGDSIDCRDYPV